MTSPLLLSWSDNRDSFAVAVVANRLAASGADIRVLNQDARGAGGYILSGIPAVRRLLAHFSLEHRAVPSDEVGSAEPLASPRIAILAGAGSAYPYYAYYAHALAALGFAFEVVDGPDLVAGRLKETDIAILPGGFAIWGLDRCENVRGADKALRDFLMNGGGCVGSCGGAYYLSEGRPGWLGLAPASPRYTHEYLRSGAGVVSVALEPGPIAQGCAPAIEMPYYHGPIYEALRAPAQVAGRFRALSMPARVPIDNPLDPSLFETEMAGKPALLTVESPMGRAVLFSTHPEMGDLVRKYVSLGSYVAHYLPIRGAPVMEQTLDFYEPNDPPAFRLILNAIRFLGPAPGRSAAPSAASEPDAVSALQGELLRLVRRRLSEVNASGTLLHGLLDREIRRLTELAERLQTCALPGERGCQRVLSDAMMALSAASWSDKGAVHQLLDLELPLRFMETSARRAGADNLIRNL